LQYFADKNISPFVSGGVAGEEKHTLTIEEMPSHNHSTPYLYQYSTDAHSGSGGRTQIIGETSTGYKGDSQPHNNIPPNISLLLWRRVS